MNLVTVQNGTPATTSIIVAEVFGKRHDGVIRAVRDQIVKINDVASEWSDANFIWSTYTDFSNRKHPMFILTKMGFAKVAFNFTGRDVTSLQIKFLREFEAREAAMLRDLKQIGTH